LKPFSPWSRQVNAWFFGGTSDNWLAALRMGLGLQLILYCITSRADWHQMFASQPGSFVTRDLTEAIVTIGSELIPRMSWLISAGESIGLSEATVLWAVWTALLAAGGCLLVGIFCRSAAITAWFFHLSAIKSSALLSYGVDNFTSIGLFYLLLSPLPDHLALDSKWRKWPLKNAGRHSFWRRVLQVHVCVIYFFSGTTKLLGSGWWSGESIWRALTRPPFDIVSSEVLIQGKYLFIPLGLGICLLETTYPIFIWPRRTRPIWLVGMIGMHGAIAALMGLYLFGLIMIVLNIAAFGTDLFTLRSGKATCRLSAA
jgi:Vitamin K-dependent gamma-carboxylase